ncbi:hypothetical protein [Hymenobacter terricola]|uniref:hypothetical protein n=1 Tax=Hymenobacter terricola TaxID=2819236 RepID=UPI001B3031BF|nr:hypothetical protein [Hymenobacter terricola]
MATFSEFLCAVGAMRAAQKQYFKTKEKRDLYHAWNMERAVDQMLEQAFAPIQAGSPGSENENPPRSDERNSLSEQNPQEGSLFQRPEDEPF